MATITLEMSNEVLAALRCSATDFQHKFRYAAATTWYLDGRISRRIAAEIAGMSRTDFLLALARDGKDSSEIDPADLDEELRQNAQNMPMESPSGEYQRRAKELIKNGQIDDAEREIRLAIDSDPHDAWNYLYLGNIHYGRGDFQAALKQFEELAAAWDDGSPAHWAMGDVYRTLGDVRRSTECYLNAVRMDPEEPIGRRRLRRCMYELDEMYAEKYRDDCPGRDS